MQTAFFWDERCFWHGGGHYAESMEIGGLVQPLAAGGSPESPETKRRLKNLIDATGLSARLAMQSAPKAGWEALARVHDETYLSAFRRLSDQGGGELGHHAPFGPGGYEIAAQSAGLAIGAVEAVTRGEVRNAYALCRPPGHHCRPGGPMGFCLLANIAVAVRAAQAAGLTGRIAVLDWDVHHGNGTEEIFYADPDVLTVSIHQAGNYPLHSGAAEDRGTGAGLGTNVNIPLPPGAGHAAYIAAMERIVLPRIRAHDPDLIVVACGYDAAAVDPLGRMLATAETFRDMTTMVRELAETLCGGRLVLVHEGGYSQTYVPFCGHAVLEVLSDARLRAPDPLAETLAARQPDPETAAYFERRIDALAAYHATVA